MVNLSTPNPPINKPSENQDIDIFLNALFFTLLE